MRERISRFICLTRKYGLALSVKKLALYFRASCIDKFAILSIRQKRNVRHTISHALEGDFQRIIIRRSSFGYSVPLFQRPQHIACSMAKQGCLIFYEVSTMTDGIRGIKKLRDNLYLVNLTDIFTNHILTRSVADMDVPRYIEVYSTDRKMRKKDLIRYKEMGFDIIYQFVDHISPEISGTDRVPHSITEKYQFAIEDPDVFIVATADALYDDIVSQRGKHRCVLATNGVDLSYFSRLEKFTLSDDFNAAATRGLPVVCYYGALASWLDYELLKKIDETNNFTVVLIGIKYDGSYESLKGLKNTYFLGHKNYGELKYYARACDVMMIPFKIGEISRSTSPVKLFEYMAIGRPIVCTDMDECRKYESVLIGKSHSEFISMLRFALTLIENEDYKKCLRREAEMNDWNKKAEEIISLLSEGE